MQHFSLNQAQPTAQFLPSELVDKAADQARKLPHRVIGFPSGLPRLQALLGIAPFLVYAKREDALQEIITALCPKLSDMSVTHTMVRLKILPQLAHCGRGSDVLDIAEGIRWRGDRILLARQSEGFVSMWPRAAACAAWLCFYTTRWAFSASPIANHTQIVPFGWES